MTDRSSLLARRTACSIFYPEHIEVHSTSETSGLSYFTIQIQSYIFKTSVSNPGFPEIDTRVFGNFRQLETRFFFNQ